MVFVASLSACRGSDRADVVRKISDDSILVAEVAEFHSRMVHILHGAHAEVRYDGMPSLGQGRIQPETHSSLNRWTVLALTQVDPGRPAEVPAIDVELIGIDAEAEGDARFMVRIDVPSAPVDGPVSELADKLKAFTIVR